MSDTHPTSDPGSPPAPASFALRDSARALDERVDLLLGRLTLAEKLALLHQHTPGVARLGLAPFHTGKEALHGAAWDGAATVFPQAVGLGATWDRELVAEVGEATAREVRAQHDARPTTSLVVWAPVVNLLRDPRWGRNEEGYSEDPLLTAELATALCRGLCGERPPYWRVAPILKHFFAYNQEDERARTSMSVRPRVLHEYELPAFAAPLAAGVAAGVMPSYNLVNGRPAHLAPEINGELRRVAPSELLVCSDAGAPSNIVDQQRYAPDHATAHAWALRAGVDSFTDNDAEPGFTIANLRAALEGGLIEEAEIDLAARRLLLARMRTGELDPDEGPFAADGEGQLCSPAHARVARRAAEESVVLLRNDGGLLPLSFRPADRLVVLGPLADVLYEDWYSGKMPYGVTLAEGLREVARAAGAELVVDSAADRVVLRTASDGALFGGSAGDGVMLGEFEVFDWGYGVVTLRDAGTGMYLTASEDGTLAADKQEPDGWICRETFVREPGPEGTVLLRHRASGLYLGRRPGPPGGGPTFAACSGRDAADALVWDVVSSGVERATALARGAAATVLAVGNHPLVNGRETEDRPGIELPDGAERLAGAVVSVCPRSVLVIMSSYPYSLGPAASAVPAACWTSHGGQETGHALAAVLTGAVEPCGRLAQTWYRSASDLPPIGDYDIIKARRTYQYFEGAPLFCFGHGLSYTSFAYGPLCVAPSQLREGEVAHLSFELTNAGPRAGTEVVQVYANPPAGLPDRPRRRLCGFARVALRPGESTAVEIAVPASRLAFWDVRLQRMALDRGEHELAVGASSGDIRCRANVLVLSGPTGPRRLLGECIAAVDFDDYEGLVLVDEAPEAGTAIAPARDAGPTGGTPRASALYREVDLGANEVGAGERLELRALVARSAPGTASLEVRTGDAGPGRAEGARLLASFEVPSTGGKYSWTEVAAVVPAGGVEDLYIVLCGEQRLARLRLCRPRTTDDPGRDMRIQGRRRDGSRKSAGIGRAVGRR